MSTEVVGPTGSEFPAFLMCQPSLTYPLVLREARRLAVYRGMPLDPVDLEVNRDGVLVCKALPAGGLISGGIKLAGPLVQMTLDDFSEQILLPWLGRMVRLKALQDDLKALGVQL